MFKIIYLTYLHNQIGMCKNDLKLNKNKKKYLILDNILQYGGDPSQALNLFLHFTYMCQMRNILILLQIFHVY